MQDKVFDTSATGVLKMMGASESEIAEYEAWKSMLPLQEKVAILRRQGVPEAIIMRDCGGAYFPPSNNI